MELNSRTAVPGISPAMWRLIWNWMELWRRNHPECMAPFSLEGAIENAMLAHEDGTRMDV